MRSTIRRTAPAILTSAAVLFGTIASTEAATRVVAVGGTDGPSCGTKTAPCRSIGRGIANAAPGDTLVVGPGQYGDLDDDGALTSPGEESLGSINCMIRVDKPLTIVSRDGAVATVIRGNKSGSVFLTPVCLVVSDVTFGKVKKGFTITGSSNTAGLRIGVDDDDTVTTHVNVSGNRASANVGGFVVAGTGNVLNGNQAVGNPFADGFRIVQGAQTLTANLSSANGAAGYFVFAAAAGTQLRGDVAAGNAGAGFQVNPTDAVVTGCVASGNVGVGFAAVQARITKSAALGNGGAGMYSLTGGTVSDSTIVGNGAVGGRNCGVENLGAETITTRNVFWGAASGSGVDPADKVCETMGPVQAAPFAAKEIKVHPKLPPID